MLKLSIIIPFYNSALTLKQCLDTLSSSKYPYFEVLLIDDNSSDNSSEICEIYCLSDKRFHYEKIPHGGVSSARNYGLKIAKGDYITFVDSDDYVTVNFEKCFDYLTSDIVVANVLTSSGNEMAKFEGFVDGEWSFLNTNLARTVWGKFYKREIVVENKIVFDESLRFGEDTLFVIQFCLKAKSVSYIKEKIYYYKEPSFSIVNKYNQKFLDYIKTMNVLIENTNKLKLVHDSNFSNLEYENVNACCFPYMRDLYISSLYSYKERKHYFYKFKKAKNALDTHWGVSKKLIPLAKFVMNSPFFIFIDLLYRFSFFVILLKLKDETRKS